MSVLRQGRVMVYGQYAGLLQETDSGYLFQYDPNYLRSGSAVFQPSRSGHLGIISSSGLLFSDRKFGYASEKLLTDRNSA